MAPDMKANPYFDDVKTELCGESYINTWAKLFKVNRAKQQKQRLEQV